MEKIKKEQLIIYLHSLELNKKYINEYRKNILRKVNNKQRYSYKNTLQISDEFIYEIVAIEITIPRIEEPETFIE